MKKKYISLIISLVFILTMCFATQNMAIAEEISEEKVYCEIDENTDFADDTIMVVLTNKVSLSTKQYTVVDFPEISCVEVNDLTEGLWQQVINHKHTIDCNPNLETKTETFHRILKLKIADSGKANVIAGIRKLEKRNDVKGANPNYAVSVAATPNDPAYQQNRQWGIAKIDLPNAWDIETGSDNVFVGVIDTGIDNTRPDLKNRVNANLSKDFADDLDQYENNPFEDNDGHGTMVAGIIGAETNNGTSVAGVCWNVSLVSLKVTNVGEGTYRDKIIEAIIYATNKNIPILNISIGVFVDDTDLKAAVDNYNGLLVTSAGNKHLDIDQEINYKYPACYTNDNIITVGASTLDDTIWVKKEGEVGSNYGLTNVDIFAPGANIFCIHPIIGEFTSGYVSADGTSMAAPFVTGVAALMLSHNDTLSANDIKTIILDNCDKIDDFKGKCVTGGRLNAYKALNNSHNYQYNSIDSTTHTKYCKCGYSETVSHTIVNHYCVDCGYYNANHIYKAGYDWINYQHHQALCACGQGIREGHYIRLGSTTLSNKRYYTCLLCGGDAERGFVVIGSSSEIQIVTENGSYVLPNGITVLVDEDIAAFLNGTLVFINNDSM